jgi:putative ABC transport system substrate-binding protein
LRALAAAQQPGKVYRIGVLADRAADSNEILAWQTFRDGLREHGWKESVNIRIESRWVEGDVARLPEMATELVRLKPDLIATRGSIFTGALKAATSSIPIVFLGHADPVGTGHVASLARPGGNITGMAVLQTEIGPKCLELLHAAVPAATRIAVLWHIGSPSSAPGLKALEEPARLLRLDLQPVGARTAADLEGAFSTMAQRRAQRGLISSPRRPTLPGMDRRKFLLASVVGGFVAPRLASAQQSGRVYRVGSITAAPPPPGVSAKLPFMVQRLRELGYVEGRNLIVEQRFAGLDPKLFPAVVAELVEKKADVLVVLGNRLAEVAKREAPRTPIVMIGGVDPVKDGLVASLARPGGTVTGLLQDVGRDVMLKQLELLKEAVPRSSRIAVIVGGHPGHQKNFEAVKSAEAALGINLFQVTIHGADDIEPAFDTVVRNRADAILVLQTPAIQIRPQAAVDLAARHRVPAAYWWIDVVWLGGLMSYGIDWADLMRRAGAYVDKILKGANPGDLPIEQPTKFDLLINVKTAKVLGVTIPPSLLLRANHLIE